ncbi:MAG: glycerol-3-phosphate 1-O-acyltransferase PlsB [Xanthomonadaceae bacterium]|nr:glycerol-3-phosphate 1-O-acyltransferase PlsB [Xanthomonadaceae bacterium]
MSQLPSHHRFPGKTLNAVKKRWLRLCSRVLNLWVRATVLPEDLAEFRIDSGAPVLYVLDTYAFSSLLILEQICRVRGWPLPSQDFDHDQVALPRSFGANRRYRGLIIRQPQKRGYSRTLKLLVDAISDGRLKEVRIVPVTVLIGRAPDKEQSIAKILFSENWDLGGRVRRFLTTLINGRATFVQFGKPVALTEIVAHGAGEQREAGETVEDQRREERRPEVALRRVGRLLRVHFKRVRTAAIGPDRSHRRTLVDRIAHSDSVRQSVAAKARRDGIEIYEAEAAARKYAREIAADYSYSFIRLAEIVFGWFWNRIYRGIEVFHFNRFRDAQQGHEVIYVPCHRSHIDYMLLSFILYRRGFVPPHIAAGINLNLPVVGRLLRYGGAFYLRRSFRAQPLYSAVFNEYVRTIISKGVALEYFVEGTRSRTGRMLPPRAGMLSITLRAFLRDRERPLLFQPVYIGYERLAEGSSYITELSGQQKKPESLADFRNVINIIRKNYGQVQVSFGEPIRLNCLLDEHAPGWAEQEFGPQSKPAWLPNVVGQLADRILVNINSAAHVNPINLLAATLLATRKQALDEADLEAMIGLYQSLIPMTAYSDRITITELAPGQIIEYGLELGVIERQQHALGDIIRVDQKNAVLLTYFRNNISHLLAMPAWIACSFLNNLRVRKTRVRRLTEAVYPFLKNELFLPWAPEEVPIIIQRCTDALVRLGLLGMSGEYLQRAPGGSDQTYYLRLLGNSMLQTFERYYITIAVLAKNGSGTLSRQQLEKMCIQSAQRISLLHEFDAPEFSDRTLFRQFIDSLQQIEILGRNDDGNLTFDRRLQTFARDAKLILDKEVRHSIIQITPRIRQASQNPDIPD